MEESRSYLLLVATAKAMLVVVVVVVVVALPAEAVLVVLKRMFGSITTSSSTGSGRNSDRALYNIHVGVNMCAPTSIDKYTHGHIHTWTDSSALRTVPACIQVCM